MRPRIAKVERGHAREQGAEAVARAAINRTRKAGTSPWMFAAMIACGLIAAMAIWYFFPSEEAVGAGSEENPSGPGQSSGDASFNVSAARQSLPTLRVAEPTSKPNYDRAAFGPAWADDDGNGCDTRNDILGRDLVGLTYADSKECTVATGTLHDPYTARNIAFRRGKTSSSAVQIDHVVALADAWRKGASGWDESTRRRFANDPANLLAVDGPLNNSKGASDASQWLPPNLGFRCAYVAAQVEVKASYDLAVTAGEKQMMESVLADC